MYHMVMGYYCDSTMLTGRLTLSTGRTELILSFLQLPNIFTIWLSSYCWCLQLRKKSVNRS